MKMSGVFISALALTLAAAIGSALESAPARAWGAGGGGAPQVRYTETPGQRAMRRHEAKKTVKQPGPFSKEVGRDKQPIHGNPTGPGGQGSPVAFPVPKT
jgi:hypothetical protein